MTSNLGWVNALVIDDSRTILDYVEAVLRDYGIDRITTNEVAQKALSTLSQPNEINLILLDLNMPGLDGIEFLERLVQLKYKGYLVIMSGVAPRIIMTVEELAKRHKLNYLGTLCKPLEQEDFNRVLDRLGQKMQKEKDEPSLKIYEIIRAIRNDKIEVLYQPQMNLHERQLYGVECLVRIEHAVLGMISPDRFLDKIEQCDLIVTLTYKVARRAIADWCKWRKRGVEPKLSINVPPFCLQQADFVDNLFEILAEFDFPPSKLCIEITESTLAKDLEQELATLSRLNMRGVELALDDFGQDHASIERLQSLPLTVLKLDKSYFLAQKHKQGQISVIQSSIALAKRLNMTVVAEGIEGPEQWRLCGEMGCDIAQGYYLSRPIVAKHLIGWLNNWRQQIA